MAFQGIDSSEKYTRTNMTKCFNNHGIKPVVGLGMDESVYRCAVKIKCYLVMITLQEELGRIVFSVFEENLKERDCIFQDEADALLAMKAILSLND